MQLNSHTIFLVWWSLITKPISPNCSIKFDGLTVQLVTLHTSIIFFVFSMGATVFVQPLDLVKNRMQMSGEYNEMACYKNVRNGCFANVLIAFVEGRLVGELLHVVIQNWTLRSQSTLSQYSELTFLAQSIVFRDRTRQKQQGSYHTRF